MRLGYPTAVRFPTARAVQVRWIGLVRRRPMTTRWGGGAVVCAGRRRELAGESPAGPAPSGVRSRRRG